MPVSRIDRETGTTHRQRVSGEVRRLRHIGKRNRTPGQERYLQGVLRRLRYLKINPFATRHTRTPKNFQG